MININDDEFVLITETAYSDETGLPRRQETRTPTGLLQSPPDGDPSVIRYLNGEPSSLIWHERGVEHRDDGPSSVTLRPDTGAIMTETYKLNGVPRTSDKGPFRIRYRACGEIWQVEHTDEHATFDDDPDNTLGNGLEPK